MTDTSWLGPPIDVRPLFARQQAAFIDLLHGFGPAQWAQPTICAGWYVNDIAAHVLGDHIGRLSRHRDGYPPLPPRDGEAPPAFLDSFNGEGVTAARRISPRLLVEQLSVTGNQVAEFWPTVDPGGLGEAVSWAGPGPAPVWLDAARMTGTDITPLRRGSLAYTLRHSRPHSGGLRYASALPVRHLCRGNPGPHWLWRLSLGLSCHRGFAGHLGLGHHGRGQLRAGVGAR